ncbi:hypothetical protein ACHAW6_001841 [Cyclotella cf. meneghiniana]
MMTVLLLTNLNVNGPSKKLTGWVIGLLHGIYSYGKNRCHPPHGSPSKCHRMMHVCGCINYDWDMWPSCAHILKPLTDQG